VNSKLLTVDYGQLTIDLLEIASSQVAQSS